jgi:hypothetical protein
MLGTLIMARGSTFMALFVAIVLLIYIIYFKKPTIKGRRFVRILLPVLLIIGIPIFINSVLLGAKVSNTKLEQFTSLFALFDFSKSLPERLAMVGTSPYVRIAEVINIVDDGMNNIFTFFIGKGYGGYYTDAMELFNGIDLSNGGFPDDMINVGRFYKGHSVYPTTLLYNGFIGLVLILKLGFSYLKRIDKTFLVFSGFMLFMYGFYFDTIALISNSIALFGAEYMINNRGEEQSI